MLRKLLLCWVVSVGCALGPNVPASAGEPVVRQFQVLVQEGASWRLSGTYSAQSDARQLAVRLWKEGTRVLIREVVTAPQK